MKKKWLYLTIVLCVLLLAGCGKAVEKELVDVEIYYLDSEGMSLEVASKSFDKADTGALVEAIADELMISVENSEYRSISSYGANILACKLNDNELLVDMSEEYYGIPKMQEILIRAAIVKSFTQLEEIEGVLITVNDQPLTDSQGLPIGVMTNGAFIDNKNGELNSYEQAQVKLYFADESGKYLIVDETSIAYGGQLPIEQAVIENLIAGPSRLGYFGTVNPKTKVNDVTVKDGVCYINLSSDFLECNDGISEELTIYSLVNSLVELETIDKVQISIDGITSVIMNEKISFDTMFEENKDIVIR